MNGHTSSGLSLQRWKELTKNVLRAGQRLGVEVGSLVVGVYPGHVYDSLPDIVPNKVHSHVYVLGAGAGLGLTVGQCPVSFKIFLHILFSREFNEPLLYRTIFPQRKKPGNFGSRSFFVLFT